MSESGQPSGEKSETKSERDGNRDLRGSATQGTASSLDEKALQDLRSFRPSSPADFSETALAYKARHLAAAFKGRLPMVSELRNVTEELGVELATALFLRTLHDSSVHGPFARQVRSFDFANWNSKVARAAQIEVAVVASNLFLSGRKWGDHTDDWRSWARDLGFTTDVIETDPRRSIAANARLIFEHLGRDLDRKRIIVTYGQGTAEFRYLLHRRVNRDLLEPMPEEFRYIRAWINVCGAFSGATSSRILQESRVRRLLARLRMKVAGRNPVTLAETSANFPLWRKPLPEIVGMSLASIVGVSNRPQNGSSAQLMFNELAHSSPNDGLISVMEACGFPGSILAVPGMNHLAANSVLEPVFKRTLAVVAQSV